MGDIDGEDERKFFCSALFATAAICKIMKHEAPTQYYVFTAAVCRAVQCSRYVSIQLGISKLKYDHH